MQRRRLIAIGAMGVWVGVVVVMSRTGSRATGESPQDSSRATSSVASEAAAERIEHRFEVRRAAAAPAGVDRGRPRPRSTERAAGGQQHGVGAGIERIVATTQFNVFAESAKLDEDQRYALARILALHYENERNLAATHSEQERASSLQRQLSNDTRAQLRTRLSMSDATWDAFERSGLLSTPPAEERGAAAAPEGDPT